VRAVSTAKSTRAFTGREKSAALKGHGSSRIVTGKEIEILKGHGFSRIVTGKVIDVLKGHGFSRIVTGKVIDVLKGYGFSRAAHAAKSTRALAPEGYFSNFSLDIRPFSAARKAGEERLLT
jgi:hypothetical protein